MHLTFYENLHNHNEEFILFLPQLPAHKLSNLIKTFFEVHKLLRLLIQALRTIA